MKVILIDCNKNDLLILKTKTDLILGRLEIESPTLLLIDLETKMVEITENYLAKMIFSNIEQFLTYYDGLRIINKLKDRNDRKEGLE